VLRFIRALNDEGPRWHGDNKFREEPSKDLAVPPTFLCSLFAGPRKADWDNPYEGLLDAGTEWDFLEKVRVGDRITVTSRITGMADKQGRVGDMLLVTTEFRYANQHGKLVATQRNTVAWYEPEGSRR
jgi:acyl dehydratase